MYTIVYTKKATADIPKLKSVKLDTKVKALIEIPRENSYQIPSSYEKSIGDLQRAYLWRTNVKHRFVYGVLGKVNTVKITNL